jgi:hypothetical protein
VINSVDVIESEKLSSYMGRTYVFRCFLPVAIELLRMSFGQPDVNTMMGSFLSNVKT